MPCRRLVRVLTGGVKTADLFEEQGEGVKKSQSLLLETKTDLFYSFLAIDSFESLYS